MARLIPRRTKVQTQFIKGLTIVDAVIVLVFMVLLALTLSSDFNTKVKLIVAASLVMFLIILFLDISPNTRTYQALADLFLFMFGVKRFTKQKTNSRKSVNALMPYVGILEHEYENTKVGVIDYKEYFGAVFEVKSIQFYMLSRARQESYISAVENALKTLGAEQSAAIYKFSRPMVLDSYIDREIRKKQEILQNIANGVMNEDEAIPRIEIVECRVNSLDAMNVDKEAPILKDHMYIAVFGKSIKGLLGNLSFMANSIEGNTNNVMTCTVLDRKQTAVFLKNYYSSSFDEREVRNIEPKDLMNWIMPERIRFSALRHYVDDKPYTTYTVAEYPISVPNAWGRSFFSVPGTKVTVKIKPVPQFDAEKRLDRSIMEMEVQASKRGRASSELEKNVHLETLRELLASIKTGNEVLFDTNIYIQAEDEHRKLLRTQLMRTGFKYNEMFGRQRDAFINGNVSQRSNNKKFERGINSSSLAAIFPFVSEAVQDEEGFFLGNNPEPVFIDFFKRDKERINSNMVILGKSGSGKSFATKNIIANLASDNTKVFILDPEREYDILARNLKGKVVDVGSAKEGRINPLQIITSLDDETIEGQNASLSTHLQFLESFFKMILDGITNDALEILNESIKELYEQFGINVNTKIEELTPDQFPIMQDLYNYVSRQYESAKDDYQRNNLKIIRTYLNKFAEGGRNSLLWNGPSTITAEENIIVFNFQSLLANSNNDLANAQMMMIMRWLNNEIIKNKDYNQKYNTKRRVIVVIDEAHTFIDPKKDVALDFMFNLAKRIRKYEGMQIVITQNLKDFTGTPDIARKSTAIINASQYSLIFSLAPHDINDLVALYEKAGQINEKEQDIIVMNPRGKAFFMTGPYSRANVDIIVQDRVKNLFEKIREEV